MDGKTEAYVISTITEAAQQIRNTTLKVELVAMLVKQNNERLDSITVKMRGIIYCYLALLLSVILMLLHLFGVL